MRPLLIQFLLCLAILTALDAVWYTTIMNRFFMDRISHLLNIRAGHVTLRWFPAILVYVFLACGIVFFVLPAGGVVAHYPPFVRGAIFGAVVYGVYEGTNAAILKDWPMSLMVAEILWSSLACGVTVSLVEFLAR